MGENSPPPHLDVRKRQEFRSVLRNALTVTLRHWDQSTLRNQRKMRWKLQILFFLTIHFSSKSDKYLIIYDPLKIKFLEKFLEFSMKIQLFRSAFEAYFQVKLYSFEHIFLFFRRSFESLHLKSKNSILKVHSKLAIYA